MCLTQKGFWYIVQTKNVGINGYTKEEASFMPLVLAVVVT